MITVRAWFFYLFMKIIPKRQISRWVGVLMAIERPRWLASSMVKAFASFYRIDLKEAELPLNAYPSVAKLFTRRLKPGVRPLADAEPLHPADGKITEWGEVRQGQLYQVKGTKYSLAKLLHNEAWAQDLEGGLYLTYYLCPTDYHRVHFPVSGQVTSAAHISGELWPVNELSVLRVQGLFAVNERVVVEVITERGRVVVVMVGATNVGQMRMSFDGKLVTNQKDQQKSIVRTKQYWPPLRVKAGDELGVFHMGSTVVVLYPRTFWGEKMNPIQGGPAKIGGSLAL